ncbi:MAG: pseudouridine synthase [Spirochaetales bacterium]|nr:pseudouridine synthase [Spirochaetales bacterium]
MEQSKEDTIDILWQDEHYAFINKPAGVLIHRSIFSSDRDTLVKRLYSQFEKPPLPVHRLDRPVSGVLAAAFSKEAAAALSACFRESTIRKTYWAVVRGYIPEEGRIEKELKNYETLEMKEAVTTFKRLDTAEIPIPSRKFETSRYSLVAVQPLTGRFHQIRRHLAGLGYPIVGDTSHGDTFCNHHFTEHFHVDGLMLHAGALELTHPLTGEELCITAEPPKRFESVFEIFNWKFLDNRD